MAFSIPFINNTGDTIPGYAVMQCNGTANVAGQAVLSMAQPSDLFCRLYYINGPIAVPDGEYGNCTDALGGPAGHDLNFALFNAGSTNDYDQPAYGQQWGPVPGEWYLERDRYGFTVVGPFIQEGTVIDKTVAINSTPNVTFTTVDTDSPADDEEAEDVDEDGEDDDDEESEEDTSDDTMDRVVVQQERVSIAHGLIQSALRNDADISGSDHTTSIADVLVQFCQTNLSANPVTYAETSTGQYVRNAKPYCLQPGDNIKSGDQVFCVFMNGQWYVVQVLTCPPAIS